MKRLIPFIALAAILATGCEEKPAPAPEIITDEYGVANIINPTEKKVYLVFTAHYSTNDDGFFENFDGIVPVLDTLADRGVKGSFFPTGNCFRVEKYVPSIQRIIDEGHYLSAHSNHHLLLCTEDSKRETLVPFDSLKVDIAGMEDELMKFGLTKKEFQWMIPPYEHYNLETADGLRKLGYSLANPTEGIDTGSDWMGMEHPAYKSAEEMVQNIWDYEEAHSTGLNGTIILIHAMVYPDRTDQDRMWWHLGEIIDGLRERGYDFATFKELCN